jgi:hypothetical protein
MRPLPSRGGLRSRLVPFMLAGRSPAPATSNRSFKVSRHIDGTAALAISRILLALASVRDLMPAADPAEAGCQPVLNNSGKK